MLDEKLIGEVQLHAIIYNRQKSSTINGDKCITKELAWQDIARNLGTDVDTCKKRWKYLRERYVQQKKVGGSPSYEHLSRPHLEKMKFLDNFIQSRKSYRQVSNLFQSPSAMQSYDGNESSKSNGSMRLLSGTHLNNDLDDTFPQYYLNQFPHTNLVVKNEESLVSDLHRKQIDLQSTSNNNMPSSSSSIASQESPATLMSTSTTHNGSSVPRKRQRTTSTNTNERNNLNQMERTHDKNQNQMLNNHLSDNDHNDVDDDDDDDDDDEDDDDASGHQSSRMNNVPNDFLYPLYEQHTLRERNPTTEHANPTFSTFPNSIDLLYQHMARQLRNSDQLLGELVTSELMKMPKNRKKIVQRKILEVLFFDDE